MKKSVILAAALSMSASVAFAGGPVVIQEEGEPEVIVTKPRSGALLPILLGVVILGAVAGGGGGTGTP